MNVKGIAGVCVFAIGILIIILSIDAIHKIAEAKGVSQDVSDFLHHNPSWNPIITFFGGEPQEKISHADTRSIMALIGGISLTILGAIMSIIHYGHKKR